MIIPIRCFTCGKVIASKWKAYCEQVAKMEKSAEPDSEKDDFFFEETPKGKVLDAIGLERICCRRHMLSHVDLVDII